MPNDVNRPLKDVNTMSQHPNAPAVDIETGDFPYVTSWNDTPCISFAYPCHMTQLSKFFDSHKYREHTFSVSDSVQLGGPFTRPFVARVPHKWLNRLLRAWHAKVLPDHVVLEFRRRQKVPPTLSPVIQAAHVIKETSHSAKGHNKGTTRTTNRLAMYEVLPKSSGNLNSAPEPVVVWPSAGSCS